MTDQTVRSVKRAIEVLGLFAQLRRPLSLKELTEELKFPSSSLADILKTLSDLGCLSFDNDTKTYFPTTRVAMLGSWVSDEILPRRDAYSALERLRAECGETILLGTRNDLLIQYLYVLDSGNGAVYRSRPNGQRPIVSSGVGWTLLSTASDDAIERLWRRSVAKKLIDRTQLPLNYLFDRINFYRTHGFVSATDSINPDAAVIATLVPQSGHNRSLAVGIGGPTERILANEAHISAVLMQQARTLCEA